MSKLVRYSVGAVRGGSGAGVVWQCTGVGAKVSLNPRNMVVEVGQWQLLKDRWSAGCVGDRSEGMGTTRDISASGRGADQLRSRTVQCSVQCAADGLKVLVASAFTRKDFTEAVKLTPSLRKGT